MYIYICYERKDDIMREPHNPDNIFKKKDINTLIKDKEIVDQQLKDTNSIQEKFKLLYKSIKLSKEIANADLKKY